MAQINSHFVDWYRKVDPVPTSEKLGTRTAAIISYSKKKQILEKGLDLVRLFFGLNANSQKNIEDFAGQFYKHDPSFSIRDSLNSLELRLLAGCTIINIIETRESPLTSALALAVLCCNTSGIRKDLPVEDIITISEAYIIAQAETVHRRDIAIEIRQTNGSISNFVKEISANLQQNNIPNLSQAIINSINYLDNSFKDSNEDIKIYLDLLYRNVVLQQEETNVLWWLISEYCHVLETHYSQIDLPSACVMAGHELGKLTLTLPGPISGKAFLNKIISISNKDKLQNNTIENWINFIPIDIVSKLENDFSGDKYFIEDICSINFCINKYYENGGNRDWVSVFEHVTKLCRGDLLSPVDFCYQYYQELILSRLIAMVNE